MREVARLGAGASIFNINEPILFGHAGDHEPIMLIPFNLVPLVLVTVQYAAMKIGAVAVTTGVFIPWTLPPVISGFIVTGHLSGSVMQILNLLIGAMLYLPFMRIVDKQYRAAEVTAVLKRTTRLQNRSKPMWGMIATWRMALEGVTEAAAGAGIRR